MLFPIDRSLQGLKANTLFAPTSAAAVAMIFEENGWKLPEDYADFISEWNGFSFSLSYTVSFPIAPVHEWNRIPFEWPSKEMDSMTRQSICRQLRFLSGIGDKDHLDIRRNQADYSFTQFVPKEFIRIGSGQFDDCIALGVCGPHFGKVAYFGGAEAHWPLKGEPTPSLDYLNFVAVTFTEFWMSLVLET
jgi:hypothetical protein